MKLNKNNFLKICEASWDLTHDGTDKKVMLWYYPNTGVLEAHVYFNGRTEGGADTIYTFRENGVSSFSQLCDPDDIVEAFQLIFKED